MFKRYQAIGLQWATCLALFIGTPVYGEIMCGVDLNGNKEISDVGEIAKCVSSPSGNLCPIGAVNCTQTLSAPTCSIGSFNAATHRCEIAPQTGTGTVRIYAQEYRSRNNCDCSKARGGSAFCALPVDTQTVASIPEGAIFLGMSAENFYDRRRRRGDDDCSYSAYNYYSVSTASCPSNASLTGTVCTLAPSCSIGTFNSDFNQCDAGKTTCPIGNQQCLPNAVGVPQCSQNACIDLSQNPPNIQQSDLGSLQNDGGIDQKSGACMDEVRIFGGQPRECRKSGYYTGYFNCCSEGSSSILKDLKECSSNDKMAITSRDVGVCHEVGEYCSNSWDIGGCVQKKKVYCCFGSKLSRIISEQGRSQIKRFTQNPLGIWGDAKAPDCAGITPEELQMLDFSKIDMTEFVGDIENKMGSSTENIGEKIETFFQNIAP